MLIMGLVACGYVLCKILLLLYSKYVKTVILVLLCLFLCSFFFFNNTATTEIYTYLPTLSLHDALPIDHRAVHDRGIAAGDVQYPADHPGNGGFAAGAADRDTGGRGVHQFRKQLRAGEMSKAKPPPGLNVGNA